MNRTKIAGLVVVGIALLALNGCVKLTGQRITWSHDKAADQLHFLLHYDGIHDSGDSKHGDARQQIQAFKPDSELMLLDWPFHVELGSLKKQIARESDDMERRAMELLARLQVKTLGHYLETDGRIGGVQLITIPDLSVFIEDVNKLISELVLSVERDLDESTLTYGHTIDAAAKAARGGHQWVSIEGHAISFTFPVHEGEWNRDKRAILGKAVDWIVGIANGKGRTTTLEFMKAGLRALSSAPLSFVDRGDSITLTLGRADQPRTFRLLVREDYTHGLEEAVRNRVPANVDRLLGTALVDETPAGPLQPLLDWGPPEDRIRALLYMVEQGTAEQQSRARSRLRKWATAWNTRGGIPRAPSGRQFPDRYRGELKRWYEAIRRPAEGK